MKRLIKTGSIHLRILLMILLGCTLLTVCALFASNSFYRKSASKYYNEYTMNIAREAQRVVNGDKIEDYYKKYLALDKNDEMYGIKVALLKDETYNTMKRLISEIRSSWNASYIYVNYTEPGSGTVILGVTDDRAEAYKLGHVYGDDDGYIGLTGEMSSQEYTKTYSDDEIGDICISCVAVQNSKDEIVAQIFVAKELDMILGSESVFVTRLTSVMIAASVIIMVLMYMFVRNSVIRPLESLSGAAEKCYVDNSFSSPDSVAVTADDIIAQAEPIMSLKLRHNDEIAQLHESIKKMNMNLRDSVKKLQDKWWESEHDPLTTLGNRAMLERKLAGEYRDLKSVLVCFIDLSGLKFINDNYNHDAGNNVIRHAAAEIKSITNERIHGYRYGGDEFLIIVCNADREADIKFISEWQSNVGSLNRATDKIKCTIAIGYEYAEGEFSIADCINKADADMYEMKRHDSNSRMFYDLNGIPYPTDDRYNRNSSENENDSEEDNIDDNKGENSKDSDKGKKTGKGRNKDKDKDKSSGHNKTKNANNKKQQ